jgi:hypothetical protein
MNAHPPRESAVITAMIGAAVVSAQFFGGKTAHTVLYLTHLNADTLPQMVVGTSILSIIAAAVGSKIVMRMPPGRFVVLSFILSGVLLLLEWMLAAQAPKLVAVLLYLHVAGLGPMLGSGFWLIATERFDPRTAKHRFGQIASAGTLGGLAGSLLASGIAEITTMWTILPILAALNFYCAWQIQRLAGPTLSLTPKVLEDVSPELLPVAARSGLRVLAEAPYLRNLAALVLLGAFAAGLLDYAYKAWDEG